MSQKVDLVPLIEWAIRRNGPEVKTREKKEKSVDVFQLLQQKRQEAQMLEAFIKDMEKVHKKEEKKDKTYWENLSTPQLAMMMIVLVPMYMILLQRIIH